MKINFLRLKKYFQHGYKFTFWNFFKTGFPLTLASLMVASAYLLVCHVVLDWNGE
jgi:Na+/H+ antiporter NhaD/arsenite permease-like protein